MSTIGNIGAMRKGHAIKRTDAEPLTREDLQYAFLRHIFDDQHAVFSDPFANGKKVTFRDLYVNALLSSPRSSRAIKDKMVEVPEYATDFAMLALLANVGRINTTMAFFPETRTALRTYHPIPALQQKSDGNLQDAPRIKNMLKAVTYPNFVDEPATPAECIHYRTPQRNRVPTTTIINLMFILHNHSTELGRGLFHQDNQHLEFMDLFMPGPYTAAERARLFLWICMHFLEQYTDECPWDSDEPPLARRRAPKITPSTDLAAIAAENADPSEEISWGAMMTGSRQNFLERDRIRQEALGAVHEEIAQNEAASAAASAISRGGDAEPPIRGRPTKQQTRAALGHKQRATASARGTQRAHAPYPIADPALKSVPSEPYARLMLPALAPAPPTHSEGRLGHGRKSRRGYQQYEYRTPSPERSLLEQAWHIVITKDPLIPSDGEENDQHVRLDYNRRLKTLNRLRGKSPTPEPVF